MRAGLKTRPRPRQLFIKYNQKNNQVKTFSISRDIWFRVEGVDRVFVGGTQEPAGDNTPLKLDSQMLVGILRRGACCM